MLNIFYLTIFSKKAVFSGENCEKLFWGRINNRRLKLIIFSKKAVFSEETAKNSSGGTFVHFLGKGDFLGKKLI